jgi:hypothetical protein
MGMYRVPGSLCFSTGGTERMRIDASGNVGIGTATATSIPGFARAVKLENSVSASYVVSGGANEADFGISSNGGWIGTATSVPMRFAAAGNEAMRIDASGNLLVGDSSTLTGARIESFGSANGVAGIGMRHTGATAGQWWRIYMQNDSKAIFTNAAGTGVSLTYGATAWAAVSDEALKENISDIGPVLDKVTNYRCVNYSLKATQSADADKIGFIAQDWEADFPNVVDRDENDELSMKYTETIPVLLKAIQEQQDLIESLTARIAALEGAN